MAKTPQQKIVTIYGNLGGDPKTRTTPAASGTYDHYDPIINDTVERTWHRPERDFLTFSIAVQTKEMTEPQWLSCVDWDSACKLYRKGDRLRLTGYLEERAYEKDGETKTYKQFVVKTAKLERAKVREEAA